MNGVEAIRSEIERRIEKYNEYLDKVNSERAAWKWAECKSLLSFIDSLQVGEPEEDIDEKIAREFFGRNFMDDHGKLSVQLSIDEFKTLLHHYYELGKK